MADRPDYVPAFWPQGGLNRPFEREPRLVIYVCIAASLAVLVQAVV